MTFKKICSRCNEEKQIALFYSDKSRKDGLSNLCKICDKEKMKIYRKQKNKPEKVFRLCLTEKVCRLCLAEKPSSEFYKDISRSDGLQSYCKPCQLKAVKISKNKRKTEVMSELVHTKQLANEFGITEALVVNYMAAAKLPAHKLLVGNEALSLFDKVAASKVIGDRMKEEKEIQAANLARIEAAKIPTLKDVMAAIKEQAMAIKVLAADVADVAELQDEIKRLTAANQGMFKALTEFKSDTADRLAGIKTLIVNMRDEKPMPSCEASSILPKVAVVGIGAVHHASIAAEFGELVNLKLLDAGDIRGIHGLRGYVKVFVMRKTTDYKHTEQLKAVKVATEQVNGSIEELREKLTNYCLNAV